MIRIGIGIGEIGNQPATVADLVVQAERAEREGFASGWIANIFGMDAITTAVVVGRETRSIELGTAVVPTYPRHPYAMAQQAMSAQAAIDGRFALGIGLSHQIVIEGMLGLSFAKPYTHMKEYLGVLAPLVREGQVSHAGEEFRVHASLRVTGAKPCPILVAALAPKMLELAGSIADGTITWMTGPRTVRDYTAPRIRQAAARAGRPEPRVIVSLPIAVTEDVAGAREAASRTFQIYGSLPSYRAMLDREGAVGPADIVVAGDEDAVGEAVERLGEGGATELLAIPFGFGSKPAEAIERTRALLVRLAGARS